MNYEISKDYWKECKLCGKTISEIKQGYGGGGQYYSLSFKKHLKEQHSISLTDYFYQKIGIDKIICSCNTCGQYLDIIVQGGKIRYKKYQCGRNPGLVKWSEQAKTDRLGINNPMYGLSAWNKGLSKNNSDIMQQTANKLTGRTISKSTKDKQSSSAKKRIIHGHTGCKHSDYAKQKISESNLRRIKNGDFKQTRTKPHLVMLEILNNLSVNFEEERVVGNYSFDFFLKEYNLLLEVDGDYFHSNPKIYPNGPATKTQKRNWYRDIKKNQFCKENNLMLIRFWECDILTNKSEVICKLKKLLQLDILKK